MNYKPRICDNLVRQKLATSGALLIEGPKWCGKTWTSRQASRSALYMQDPDKSAGYRQMANVMPSRLLQGEKPRLIDEWQEAPALWDAVRFDVDKTGAQGQYILTGSATPQPNKKPMHTGTGRIARLLMRPMTLFESNESCGSVSLKELFDKTPCDITGESPLSVPAIAQTICRGGWPAATNGLNSPQVARNYLDAVINYDINRADGVERNPHRVRQLLRSYARNISTMASLATIQADVQANDTTFSEPTLYSYLNAFRQLFLIEDIPAWKPSLRSKSALRTTEKRQFVDPSIAAAVLNADADALLDDFPLFGFLFESLVARDLRVYTQALNGDVFHYRDSNKLEIDLIIRLHDGRWAPVEVKISNNETDNAAKHLIALRNKVNTDKTGEPSFLMVITAGQFAYRRPDGIYVVPIACLKH